MPVMTSRVSTKYFVFRFVAVTFPLIVFYNVDKRQQLM